MSLCGGVTSADGLNGDAVGRDVVSETAGVALRCKLIKGVFGGGAEMLVTVFARVGGIVEGGCISGWVAGACETL